jgi:hypothetical protein
MDFTLRKSMLAVVHRKKREALYYRRTRDTHPDAAWLAAIKPRWVASFHKLKGCLHQKRPQLRWLV